MKTLPCNNIPAQDQGVKTKGSIKCSIFTALSDQRLAAAEQVFSLMTGAELGEFIKHLFQTTATSASPGVPKTVSPTRRPLIKCAHF